MIIRWRTYSSYAANTMFARLMMKISADEPKRWLSGNDQQRDTPVLAKMTALPLAIMFLLGCAVSSPTLD